MSGGGSSVWARFANVLRRADTPAAEVAQPPSATETADAGPTLGVAQLAENLLFAPPALSSIVSEETVDFAEGERLVDIFFGSAPAGRDSHPAWCKRRVVSLRFQAPRRGHWRVIVDFTLDEGLPGIPTLSQPGEVLVPLFTFAKDIMPRAHVELEDDRGFTVPMESTRRSRVIACTILLTLAKRAGAWAHTYARLAELTDTDPRTAFAALEDVSKSLEDLYQPESSAGFFEFANAVRLFHRSVILLAAFPLQEVGSHKVMTFTYDAPLRLTRLLPERLGYAPLRVAPLTVFGGDALTYHVQLEPLEGVVAVDSRVLYAYTGSSAKRSPTHDRGEPPWTEDNEDRELLNAVSRQSRPRLHRRSRGRRRLDDPAPYLPAPLPAQAGRLSTWRRWWGYVEGSAEPMSAHVRVGSKRMPLLREGRDAISIFHLYPDMSALSGLVAGAALNAGYVVMLYLGLVSGTRLADPLHRYPETVFIVGVLVAGFGSGLALFGRHHLIALQVARPWRLLFSVEVLAVLVSLVALLFSVGRRTIPSQATNETLRWDTLVAVLAMIYLLFISSRAALAQSAGSKILLGRQGYVERRRRYKRRLLVDDRRRAAPLGRKGYELSRKGRSREARTMQHLAEHYLNDELRRELFNRGIPAASRHERRARGSTAS